MKTDKLYELKEKLIKELGRYSEKELTSTSLEFVDKLAHAVKNVGKLIEMCEEGEEEYSSRSYRSYDDGGVEPGRAMPNYRSYARGRRSAPRDSMGRYSGDGYSMHGAADKLRELMDEAPDEQTRREIERLAAKMER